MRRFLSFLLFVLACLSLPALAKRGTEGFRLAKMELSFPNRPTWEVPMDPSIRSLLEQRFFYLAKGSQCYVFESKDRQVVIKLFRYARVSKEEKGEILFNACKMAYDFLREETALLYVHLNVSKQGLPILRCIDPVGRRVHIPLDSVRFAIQKKGEDFFAVFEKALPYPDQMKRHIDGFVDLLVSRARKGILNTDPTLGANFGFVEGKVVEFDFGNYRRVPDLEVGKEVRRYTSQMERWLQKRSPQWAAYLHERVEEFKEL